VNGAIATELDLFLDQSADGFFLANAASSACNRLLNKRLNIIHTITEYSQTDKATTETGKTIEKEREGTLKVDDR